MKQHDARFYWEKHEIVKEQWDKAIECLYENSSPLFVGELNEIYELMKNLECCAKEHEHHDKGDEHERQMRTSDAYSDTADNPRRHSARS